METNEDKGKTVIENQWLWNKNMEHIAEYDWKITRNHFLYYNCKYFS